MTLKNLSRNEKAKEREPYRNIEEHTIAQDSSSGESQISLVLTLSQYLAECDHVILMKDGQIAEHGTHSQLMGRDRDYAALFNSVQQEVMHWHALA